MLKHSPEILTPWARPTDVHSIERERFPLSVSGRSRFAAPLTLIFIGACFGACFVLICLGLISQFFL